MRLQEIITRDLVLYDLKVKDNTEAIQRLVQLLVKKGKIPLQREQDALLALFKREALSSTGLEQAGLAIPHARVDFVQSIVGALAVAPEGVDFRADGPSYVIFLFLSPQHRPSLHLECMSLISALARNQSFLLSIQRSRSSEEVFQQIVAAEDLLYPQWNEPKV
ncbi:MAG: PTS sugar transporter subunit IIA [Planctomycetota bacterium]|nr:MAG: PTS sugar transporter subunit IIA [Planctomycetota bacterium]